MAQDLQTQHPKLRKLHASVLRWRRKPASDFLLCDEDFRFAADCERMRVDRNGSNLSLLLVRLHQQYPEDLAFFARVLEGRLRVTDTPGHLKDGRVAILLPDTSSEGAWKVATDISEIYPPGPGRPECEVLVYPNHGHEPNHDHGPNHDHKPNPGRGRDDDPIDDDPIDDNPIDDNLAEGHDSSEKPHHESEQEIAGSSSTSSSERGSKVPDEFFFAKSHPLWKRSLDVLGGTVGILFSLPILAAAAVTVKATSRGPVFFRQQREGHGGEQFTMWKLRTMHLDAEEKKHELRKYSQQDGPAFKMKKDPRTTPVGRFLRWSSMDELPQFWNVIKGDMSLVGPRPLPIEESIACEGWQRRRLQVVPGMTCTWQISERGSVSFDEWARMDLRYVKNRNLMDDVRLMLKTLPSLLIQRGMR